MNKPLRLFCLIILFTLLSTYNPRTGHDNILAFFPIKKILIEGNIIIKESEIKNELNFLYNNSLLFLNTKDIEKFANKFDFISTLQVKKIYPQTIKLIVTEKLPVAIFIDKKKRFYLIKNGDLIKYIENKTYSKLPNVFGKKDKFKKVYKILDEENFPTSMINSFLYFEIGRWDLILENDIVIKLPNSKERMAIKSFMKIKDKKNFEKYKLFDYRINDQLILK